MPSEQLQSANPHNLPIPYTIFSHFSPRRAAPALPPPLCSTWTDPSQTSGHSAAAHYKPWSPTSTRAITGVTDNQGILLENPSTQSSFPTLPFPRMVIDFSLLSSPTVISVSLICLSLRGKVSLAHGRQQGPVGVEYRMRAPQHQGQVWDEVGRSGGGGGGRLTAPGRPSVDPAWPAGLFFCSAFLLKSAAIPPTHPHLCG